LRGYFQFLKVEGQDTEKLIEAVPTISVQHRHLTHDVVKKDILELLLNSVDKTTSLGKRTYASILCLSDLSMRIGDVAQISIDDIDWSNGMICIGNNKSLAPFKLPLPKRVGDALADYVMHGRPLSSSRQIFLCHFKHNMGADISAGPLEDQIRIHWKKIGLYESYSGTHILRHTAATQMCQSGISIKVIADILGHASIQTTTLYAQVNMPALRQVVQAWPPLEPK